MKAIVFRKHGGIEVLELTEMPEPECGPNDALVRVRACALNHLDIWVRQGLGVPIPMPHISGSDVAGEVAQVGTAVKSIKVGQRCIVSPGITFAVDEWTLRGDDSQSPRFDILGMGCQGGYAQYVAAPAHTIIPVSEKLSWEEWAAIPLVFLTAWHMLVTRAKLRAGETVLVHAAGSGIGSAAIQIAKLAGARVLTTVGSDAKIEPAKKLGADEVIHYRKANFAEKVWELTGKRGADVIFEHIGPETWEQNLRCLARSGRLVTCGATSGANVTMDVRQLFIRQHSIIGSYMGGQHELVEVVKLFEAGKLKPVVDKIFPLSDAAAAQQRMLDRLNFGKIVLRVD